MADIVNRLLQKSKRPNTISDGNSKQSYKTKDNECERDRKHKGNANTHSQIHRTISK